MKRFSFEDNWHARTVLVRALRHISQQIISFDKITGLVVHPPPDSPFWIIERILCDLELEFETAKKAKDAKRANAKLKARTA